MEPLKLDFAAASILSLLVKQISTHHAEQPSRLLLSAMEEIALLWPLLTDTLAPLNVPPSTLTLLPPLSPTPNFATPQLAIAAQTLPSVPPN